MPVEDLPVVSVQRAGSDDLVAGHLAWGSLLAADTVVVPGPVGFLDDPSSFDVLVAAVDESGPVERFWPARVDVIGLAGAPDGAGVIIRLLGSSAVGEMGSCFDPNALDAQIAEHGDVWMALESVGAVPGGLRDREAPELLEQVGRRWARQRDRLVRTTLLESMPDGWINPWCLLSPRCGCT